MLTRSQTRSQSSFVLAIDGDSTRASGEFSLQATFPASFNQLSTADLFGQMALLAGEVRALAERNGIDEDSVVLLYIFEREWTPAGFVDWVLREHGLRTRLGELTGPLLATQNSPESSSESITDLASSLGDLRFVFVFPQRPGSTLRTVRGRLRDSTPLPDFLQSENCFHAAAAIALARSQCYTAKPTSKEWIRQCQYDFKDDVLVQLALVKRALPLEGHFDILAHARPFAAAFPALICFFLNGNNTLLLNAGHITPPPEVNPLKEIDRSKHPFSIFHKVARNVAIFRANAEENHIEYLTYSDIEKEQNNSKQMNVRYCIACERTHTPFPKKKNACPIIEDWKKTTAYCGSCATIHHPTDTPHQSMCPNNNCATVLYSRGCAYYHSKICAYKYDGKFDKHRKRKQREEEEGFPFCAKCQRHHGSNECTLRTSALFEDIQLYDQVWAWDTEAALEETEIEIGGKFETCYNHKVNCIVAIKVFPPPEENEKNGFAWTKLDDFVTDMEASCDKRGKIYLWAHNLSGYDGRHLMAYLLEKGNVPNEASVIQNNKFFKIGIGRLVFMDFYKHFSQSLDSSIQAYGIEQDSGFESKLFFPYRFNFEKNGGYVGPFPGREWFDVDLMKEDRKARFEAWYPTMEGTTFDLDAELIQYCRADTIILAKALSAHHFTMKDITGYTPLYSTTSPGFARAVWQQSFYNPLLKTIPRMRLVPSTQEQYEFERQSIHGGRTDVRTLCFELTEEEIARGVRIRYVDVTSMYPFVMKTFQLPCGQVKERVYDDRSQPSRQYLMENIYIAEIDIDPPEKYLHHPVLVTMRNGKLVAPLEPLRNYVVTSIELKLAIANGYILRRVHKIHEYEATTDLFAKYVDAFMEVKDRAAQEGNRAKKQLAKIMLNSLYGKFMQRPNIPTTQYFSCLDQREMDAWQASMRCKAEEGSITLESDFVMLRQEGTLVCQVKTLDTDLTSSLQSIQAAVGSFIAAGGRFLLGKELIKLGTNVLYHDTDSIVYLDDGGYRIPEGKGLGQWIDECENGDIITHFVSLAPKTYAYKIRTKEGKVKEIVKAKGLTLHASAKAIITYDSMKQLLFGEEDEYLAIDQFNIEYKPKTQTLRSRVSQKLLTFNPQDLKGEMHQDSKRRRDLPVYVTMPFGWKQYNQ